MRTIELPVTNEWTPELLEGLPTDYRYEVSEGRLTLSARAMRPWQADGIARVCRLLRAQGRLAYHNQGVVVGPGEIGCCDVGVFHGPPKDAAYHPARAFELVVDAVSPAPARYAAGRIPEYWRVDEIDGDTVIYQHRLVRDEYVESRVVLLSALEAESV
jgi:hypothetical protein